MFISSTLILASLLSLSTADAATPTQSWRLTGRWGAGLTVFREQEDDGGGTVKSTVGLGSFGSGVQIGRTSAGRLEYGLRGVRLFHNSFGADLSSKATWSDASRAWYLEAQPYLALKFELSDSLVLSPGWALGVEAARYDDYSRIGPVAVTELELEHLVGERGSLSIGVGVEADYSFVVKREGDECGDSSWAPCKERSVEAYALTGMSLYLP